ncbi:MAG TPA: 5-methyltetrahydropteroyltriglutamate--homocysteine S-methyltransferase [Actinomycetota bacterium]|nr:5-methyltetrahydropteroyltriglutamate--homocysteine S-methyltransferase [Actinomycetota bacterium]
MARSSVSGFPRIGPRRELKFATEGYWKGKTSADELAQVGSDLRRRNWELMREAGVDLIPSGDFTFYDQVLDAIAMVGAVPARYGHRGGEVDLDTYFAMARGRQTEGVDVVAMEMTKWFNTNYHYIVPELGPETRFTLSSDKPVAHYLEAKALGIETVPVLVGPVTFLLLAKPAPEVAADFDTLSVLDSLLDVYEEVLTRLGAEGAEWVQMDEPAFVQDRGAAELDALRAAYERLGRLEGRPKIVVKTYFDHAGEAYPVLRELPVEGVGLDFVAGGDNERLIAEHGGVEGKTLFAGVVNGRNIWINDFAATLDLLDRLKDKAAEVVVATSSSLQHVPVDKELETDLDPEIGQWLTFAVQKVGELVTVARGFSDGRDAIATELEQNRATLEARRNSARSVNPEVRRRVQALTDRDFSRPSGYADRSAVQQAELNLPLFPTTTIGSYPQTDEIRRARALLRSGSITPEQYAEEMRREVERVIRFQEKLDIDVLVHGEPERNDMVQYFAEQMDGYLFTTNGWVQSYGSRYVRPPVIYGDVSRPQPMTLEWLKYAQSLTDRPVKGMLTGPVTMLVWSFVRDDQPWEDTCIQLALAIRDEVNDLEAAGFHVIQVDEAALREGMPLRADRARRYLDWAVRCFRLTTSGVADKTNIQMHMCYSEFGDIIDAIDNLDADVALIEAARSNMELLDDFANAGYSRAVGPGVYDIHSPRVPSVDEMAEKLRVAASKLDRRWIWVNPDCGLKTRGWAETEPSLKNMVQAAAQLREEFAALEGSSA